MLIELKKPCFVYVIYLSAEGQVRKLFPDTDGPAGMACEVMKKYYVQKDDLWFELDEGVGLETFYLLAAVQRLDQLEVLLEKNALAKSSEKSLFAEQILKEIRRIRKHYQKLTTTVERPVSIGGNVRDIDVIAGTDDFDIDPIAADVSAAAFYSRTFTIEHE